MTPHPPSPPTACNQNSDYYYYSFQFLSQKGFYFRGVTDTLYIRLEYSIKGPPPPHFLHYCRVHVGAAAKHLSDTCIQQYLGICGMIYGRCYTHTQQLQWLLFPPVWHCIQPYSYALTFLYTHPIPSFSAGSVIGWRGKRGILGDGRGRKRVRKRGRKVLYERS